MDLAQLQIFKAVVEEGGVIKAARKRSEEHTSELQSHVNLVCRLLLEKKNRDREDGAERARPLQLRRTLSVCSILFCASGDRRHLHSFPTRRSSDLWPGAAKLNNKEHHLLE